MRVSVVGTGYVGIVTGTCLASRGHEVICVDNDAAKVARIARGEVPIHEDGLEPLLRKTLGSSLHVTSDLRGAVQDTDLTLIAVGTPFDGSAIDLRPVRAVATEIGRALREKDSYHVVVVKSTVVPGTTDHVVRPLLEEASGKRAGEDFGVGVNPEFLTEGRAVFDFMNPDRIVAGGMDEASREQIALLYASFDDVDVVRTTNGTAEMIKYTSNALLAALISYSNEIANLCAVLGDIDASEVMDGVHRSQYLTLVDGDGRRRQAPLARFLEPGCGFGGSCLPKDVSALISHAKGRSLEMPLLQAVLDINSRQPQRLIELVGRHFDDLSRVRVAVLGLAFKPDTDDVRESPAFPVIRGLLALGADVVAYDPVANEAAAQALGATEIEYAPTLRAALSGADAVVLVTRWDAFHAVPELLREMAATPVVVDGRRMLDKNQIDRYEGIGL